MASILKKENRNVEAVNINSAKKIAILFNGQSKEQLKQAVQLKKDLKKQYPNLEPYFLGCYHKVKPSISEEMPQLTWYSKNDYGFFYNPKETKEIREFTSRDYDIIMDLSMEFVFPLKRILLNLNTRLRVGLFSQNNEPFFDLFINSRKDVSEFSKHALHYLSILNKTQ